MAVFDPLEVKFQKSNRNKSCSITWTMIWVKKNWSITRLKTSRIFRNLKVDAYPFKLDKTLLITAQKLRLRDNIICETRLDRNMCIFHRLKAKSQPHWTLTTPLLHAKIMGKITIATKLTKSKVANWRIQLMRPRTRQLWCFWPSISMATRTQSQVV